MTLKVQKDLIIEVNYTLQYYFLSKLYFFHYNNISRIILAKYSNNVMIDFAISQMLKKHTYTCILSSNTAHVSNSP